MEIGRKRGRNEGLNGNGGAGGFKKNRGEDDSSSTVKKPCTKFFSTDGCPFGEGCHFLHHVPGGMKAVSEMRGGQHSFPPSRNPMMGGHRQAMPPASSPQVKTKMCQKFNTAEGCKFGEKCHFAHDEREIGRPAVGSFYEDPRGMGGRNVMGGRFDPAPYSVSGPLGGGGAAGFGASAAAKISVAASLAGSIIGKGGVNSKQICRVTGVKLSIKEHESDENLRNIELEGTFEQISQASAMVRELIVNVSSSDTGFGLGPMKNDHHNPRSGPAGGNIKTKLCDNFAKGTCTYGERCNFAHGPEELRKAVP